MNAQPQRYFHKKTANKTQFAHVNSVSTTENHTKSTCHTLLRSSKENYVRPSLGTLTNIIFVCVCVVATQCSDFRTTVYKDDHTRPTWLLLATNHNKKTKETLLTTTQQLFLFMKTPTRRRRRRQLVFAAALCSNNNTTTTVVCLITASIKN